MTPIRSSSALAFLAFTFLGTPTSGQAPSPAASPGAAPVPAVDPDLYDGMRYRMVGPLRGGRVTAVTGFADDVHSYVQGASGGGVWHTDDAGHHWWPMADDALTAGAVGAVAVADADPTVLYVGTGSVCIRGNVSVGRGAWKSEDRGDTWTFIGLPASGAIGEIVVHPDDPATVYAAALGNPFGPNPERGVYRTKDGGESWENVLFLNDSTGAVALAMNPENPEEIFAGMWRAERKPWTLISGSEDGGIYRSRDGGDSWTKLTGGLPEGLVGKVGLSISPANPSRVWAMVEAEPGNGLWRSDDSGDTWAFVNGESRLAGRAFYYHHVVADPTDDNTVYVLNTRLYRSTDGGESFTLIPIPHGDLHDMWIHPDDPEIFVVGSDGGAVVTLNHGATFSTVYNQPTAEFYDVVVDNRVPYRLYGSQQDNTTISVPSRMGRNQLRPQEGWRYAAGCETGPIALDPDDPDVIWGGCYGGVINRMDVSKDTRRNVNLYPASSGMAPSDLRYRFQWVAPIVTSPQDPETVYHASQYVHRTRDRGMTWETISPDLSYADPNTLRFPGGPIHADNTGVEVFATVFTLTVSPHDGGTLWAGTDDGRVHVTRDDGMTWTEVTPPDLPRFATVNSIDVSARQPGRAFFAAHAYRLGDPSPYVWRTDDYGQTWTRLTDGANGIPADHWVRVVREDPERRGLLYAGTEFGIFVSFDDGVLWQPLRMNLPATPITDLEVHQDDLVVATQGRSFWILDDLTPLRELAANPVVAGARLFTPRDAARGASAPPLQEVDLTFPDALPEGALLHFTLAGDLKALRLTVLDTEEREATWWAAGEEGDRALPTTRGLHRIHWDLRYDRGNVKALPGTYTVRLTWDGGTSEAELKVVPDPGDPDITLAAYREQFRVSMAVADTLGRVRDAIERLETIDAQVDSLTTWSESAEAEGLAERVRAFAATLERLQQQLTSHETDEGPSGLRTLAGLDRQYTSLLGNLNGGGGYGGGSTEGPPTAGALERQRDLDEEWGVLSRGLARLLEAELAALNVEVERLGGPVIEVR
jgi:photosystem II stability/assembly factor-like uncharacterized protein